jgi:hypothetical protein
MSAMTTRSEKPPASVRRKFQVSGDTPFMENVG